MKKIVALICCTFLFCSVNGQIKYVNREVAQKNYEGYILLQDNKYKEALELFNLAIEQDPEAYFVYQNRALCKLNLKDTIGAISDYQYNIKLDSVNGEAYYALGNIYKNMLDTSKTCKMFEHAIKLADEEFSKTKLSYMHQFLGNVNYEKNNFDSAIAHFNWITKTFPDKSNFYVKLGLAYFMTDSMKQSCNNLKLAYVYGEAVPYNILSSLCPDCADVKDKRLKIPSNEKAIDANLAPMLKDYSQLKKHQQVYNLPNPSIRKKIYYNGLWEITDEKNASYYRDVILSPKLDFYAGSFSDYYINDSILAKGTYNKRFLDKEFIKYYQNGQIAVKGEFKLGVPIGIWDFYYEDGSPWFKVKMENGDMNLVFINKKDGTNCIPKGTGLFDLKFKTAEEKDFNIKGELLNNGKEGKWELYIDGKLLLQETFKKGKFKKGFIVDYNRKVVTSESNITGWVFIPQYLNKAEKLQFETENTIFNYPFLLNSKN